MDIWNSLFCIAHTGARISFCDILFPTGKVKQLFIHTVYIVVVTGILFSKFCVDHKIELQSGENRWHMVSALHPHH